MSEPTFCVTCNQMVPVGSWPWCPHGQGNYTEIGDEWPGGGDRIFENMGHEPVVCRSKSDWKRELKARNLEPMVRWAGPGDQHVQRMVTVDAYTLRQAEALVARVSQEGKAHDPEPDEQLDSLRMEVTCL